MPNRRIFYVYVYFRLNGEPCYIGKGCGDRWLDHERSNRGSCNKHLASIIKNTGGPLPKLIIRDHLTEAEAFETEAALIAVIGRGEKGPLVNFTDGGEGSVGYKPSLEYRAKMSISVAKALSNADVKSTMIAKAKASWDTVEKRITRSLAIKEGANRPEVRAASSANRLREWANPELRSKHIKSFNDYWAKPGNRTRHSAILKIALSTPEVREQRRESRLGKRHSEETKARMRAAWVKRKARLADTEDLVDE